MADMVARVQRFSEARRLYRFAGLGVLGALAALGQAPWNLWPLTFLALAVVYGLYTHAPDWRRAASIGFWSGAGYFALSLSWIVEPFFVDIVRHGWLAPFAILGVSFGFAIFWALSLGVARALGGGALAWIGAFTAFEALRGWLMTGFPWAQVGHVLISTPWLYWSSWAGALGLILLVLVGASAIWNIFAGRRLIGGATVLALACLFVAGAGLTPPPTTADQMADAPIVRLIQPNAPQHEKWDPDKIQGFYDRQVAFTAEPGENGRPDMVIWPETALPVLLNHAEETLAAIATAAQGSEVVLGLRRLEGDRIFNSLIFMDREGKLAGLYDKHHLVPFGEFMPLGGLLAKFGIKGLAAETGAGFSSGPGAQVLEMGSIGKALPLICYEGVFARNILSAPERPNVLLMITNDAWFGKVSGPYQHLAKARLRSVEQGLPMVRAANTGVSAVIDGAGHILVEIPLGKAGWIDAPLPPALAATPYSRLGDMPFVALALLLCAIGAATRARRSNSF